MFLQTTIDTVLQTLINNDTQIRRDFFKEGDIIEVDVADSVQLLADGEAIATAATAASTPFKVEIISNPAFGNAQNEAFPVDAVGYLYNDGDGVLSWDAAGGGGTGTTSSLTDLGGGIFRHNDGAGTTVDFSGGAETLTSVSYSNVTKAITYTDEAGTANLLDLSALAADIYVDSGAFDTLTNILTLSDNNAGTPDITVDLTSLKAVLDDAILPADDAAGAGGVATTVARSDHKHGAQAVSADLGNLLKAGTDALHLLDPADLVQPDDAILAADDAAGDGGVAATYARSDHKHIAQAVSADVGNLLKAGTDDLHLLDPADLAQPADNISPAADDAVGLIGVGLEYAREDHKHPAQGVSADLGNDIIVGTDGLHFLEETVTDLALSGIRELEYTDEAGTTTAIDVSMVGADGTNAGEKGFVPQPGALDHEKFLRGDGTWTDVPANQHGFVVGSSITPATAGNPTAAEIETALGAGAVDRLVYYTGTDVGADPITHIFHIDAIGSTLLVWTATAGATNRLFLSETDVAPFLAGAPTEAEISAAAGFTVDVVAYYTGTDVSTDTPTYVYHIDAAGAVTLLQRPVSVSGLSDANVSASGGATIAWGFHTVGLSGNEGDTITLAASSAVGVGGTLEFYNASSNNLVLALDASDVFISSPVDLTIPPNSGFSARALGASKVEVVGVGQAVETVDAANGYAIIGDIMIQWGSATITDDNPEVFTFPTAFGAPAYSITVNTSSALTPDGTGQIASATTVVSRTATTFTIDRDNDINGTYDFDWIAVGSKP